MPDRETSLGGDRESFLTTRWTVLQRRDTSEIITSYWRPVYAYLRRKGRAVEDAKDLTQAFFTRFIEKDYAAQADASRGRFRSFLRAAVDHFVADESDRQRAAKRGGGQAAAFDTDIVERLASSGGSPEEQYDRQWAKAVLDGAAEELAAEFDARGQAAKFAEIRPFLAGGSGEDRSTLHRARKRFGELVRARVLATVASPGDVEDELKFLFESLRRNPGSSS